MTTEHSQTPDQNTHWIAKAAGLRRPAENAPIKEWLKYYGALGRWWEKQLKAAGIQR